MNYSAGRSSMAPVEVAGIGAVTGYGWGFHRLVAGVRSGATSARAQEVDGLAVVAAVVPPRTEDDVEPVTDLGVAPAPAPAANGNGHPRPRAPARSERSGHDHVDEDLRFEQAAMFAVADALADARARGWEPGPMVGIIFCTGIGDIRTMRDNYFRDAPPRPSTFPHMLHTSVPSLIGQRYGWTGPNVVVNSACSSGNSALQMAQSWLASGLASDVIVAGAEFCLVEEIITGFRRMRVLVNAGGSPDECRPFQDGSRRFFLGEAAVGLVVTGETDPADTRARAVYLGGAATHDAFHLVAPEPEGAQLERCYREALLAAGVKPDDIALVKAHGSGTPLNDAAEAALLDRLFPAETRVCSYKPLVGHCMAAASLVELAGLIAGYEAGALPTHVTGADAHPRLADGGRPPDGLVLCGSVGLGGSNTAAVLDIPRPTRVPPSLGGPTP